MAALVGLQYGSPTAHSVNIGAPSGAEAPNVPLQAFRGWVTYENHAFPDKQHRVWDLESPDDEAL